MPRRRLAGLELEAVSGVDLGQQPQLSRPGDLGRSAGDNLVDSAEALRERTPTLLAGALWRRAVDAREREDYETCAETFVAIYNRFEDHDRADELLVNASECLRADFRVDEAIAVTRIMLTRYPDSEHAKESWWQLAQLELDIGRYGDALEDFLAFARASRSQSRSTVLANGDIVEYPVDRRRDEALIAAFTIAEVLGPTAAVDEVRALFGQRDHYQKPTRAQAVAHWGMRPSSGWRLAEFARVQLELFEQAWPVGALEARVVLGEDAWRRSCRGELEHGLCVSGPSARARACSPFGEAPPKLRRRRSEDVDAAISEFRRVVDQGLGWPRDEADEARAHAALDAAEFHLLEPELEACLTSQPDAVAAEALAERYAAIATTTADDALATRASARVALIWDMLAGSTCPADDVAVARAKAAYEVCLDRAIASGQFDEVARRCEAALSHIDPEAFPPLRELVSGPSSLSSAPPRSVGVLAQPGVTESTRPPTSLPRAAAPKRSI